MARDLGVLGIRVMTIAPGSFDTPIFGFVRRRDEGRPHGDRAVPEPHGCTPTSSRSSSSTSPTNPYLNGEVIRIDGAVRFPPK